MKFTNGGGAGFTTRRCRGARSGMMRMGVAAAQASRDFWAGRCVYSMDKSQIFLEESGHFGRG